MTELKPSRGWQGAVMKLMRASDYRLTLTGRREISPRYLRLSFNAGGMLDHHRVHPTMWIRIWFAAGHQRGYTLVDPDPRGRRLRHRVHLREYRVGLSVARRNSATPSTRRCWAVTSRSLTRAMSSSVTPPRCPRSTPCCSRSAMLPHVFFCRRAVTTTKASRWRGPPKLTSPGWITGTTATRCSRRCVRRRSTRVTTSAGSPAAPRPRGQSPGTARRLRYPEEIH